MKKSKNDESFKKGGGVNYNAISDKRIDDKRHERERINKERISKGQSNLTDIPAAAASSTYDALQRMVVGKDSRTLAEKIANPNRPTWEQYKKDNEDKLDNVGQEMRKMAEYRAQLDKEREERLANNARNARKRRMDYSSGEEYDDNSESDDSNNRKVQKKKSSSKKEKKTKKDKKKKSKKKKRTSKHSDTDSINNSIASK